MIKKLLTITSDPAGATYRALLAFAEQHSDSFSLVWRRQLDFDTAAAAVEHGLRPALIDEVETESWPGTRLLGHTALVRKYRPTPEAMSILAIAESLFAWRAPSRPEDLAFYVTGDQCWLGSIAHEADAFIDPKLVSVLALRSSVEGLLLAES